MSEVNNRLIIIGASGHGKVVADIAMLMGYTEIVFLDDNENIQLCGRYPVVGKSTDLYKYDGDVFIGIGNAKIRKSLMEKYCDRIFPILIHPNAVIAEDVALGIGTVVMAGAVVNPGTTIGKGCIINTCSSVDHDCVIWDYVHIAVGSHVCGTVKIGESTWLGAGATVSNNVNICSGCMVGAGAVVVKDINEKGTYFGVPAKINY